MTHFCYCESLLKCCVMQVLLQRLREAEQFEQWEAQEDQVLYLHTHAIQ